MPTPDGAILFLEQGDNKNLAEFDAQLEAILGQPGADKLQGLIIGRFRDNDFLDEDLGSIIAAKPSLAQIPVVANAGFGHTTPIATIAIGGEYGIYSSSTSVSIEVIQH
jgi:muramoyltetrapeptide carboxypeptidase